METTGKELTLSQRFALKVQSEVSKNGAIIKFDDKKTKLAQHLFMAIHSKVNNDPDWARKGINWNNIDLEKLYSDACHIVDLGIDALIPNHVSIVPYFSEKKKLFTVALQLGYAGKDYIKRKWSIDPIESIRYELVHENDEFIPKMKSASNQVECYEFNIKNPFDRGKIIGGFGYIEYEVKQKNKLIIVTGDDFEESRKRSPSDKFWGKFPTQMKFSKLVHRVTDKINIDPDKITESYIAVESQSDPDIEADAFENSEIIEIEQPKKEETKPEKETDQENEKPDF